MVSQGRRGRGGAGAATFVHAGDEVSRYDSSLRLLGRHLTDRTAALEVPFLLLSFRPDDDLSAARSFIRNFFKNDDELSDQYQGSNMMQELRLLDPTVRLLIFSLLLR